MTQEYCLTAAKWFYYHGYHKSSWYWLLMWANAKGEGEKLEEASNG